MPGAKKELNQNHDLLKLLAKAYSESADKMLKEIKADANLLEKYGTNAEPVLDIIKARIKEGIDSKDTNDWEKVFPLKEFLETQKEEKKEPKKVSFLMNLFSFSPKEDVPISGELAAKMSSEDFILNMADDPETSKKILTREIEITIKRWHFEKSPDKYELNHSIKNAFYERLAELIPKFTGTLVKQKENNESWLAFQRSHLQAILKEVKDNKGLSEEDRKLLKPLAEKLDELAYTDFPKQLADSTASLLLRLDESEAKIKQCVKDETAKLQDFLVGMESRIIEEIHKISREQPLPNSIPNSVGFVGREDYLKEIRRQYQNGTRIFVFHGIGGVGKSALALAFASEIKEEYQAKVFVDMQGLNENPLSARDAMFDILVREFKEQIPPDTSDSQLLKAFNSTVQNQPTLIVLDNAENIDSVESLTNADNACFIITSRKRIYFGEEPFEILKMSKADAVKLLLDKGGDKRFGEFTQAFAEECGYLPLALKVIKGLWMTKRLLRVDDFLEKFKAEKLKYLDEVTASLNLSYETIGDELQTLWRKLAVFPADFDSAACAAIWNVDVETAETKLDELDSYSLIEVNLETRRFNLHDLAREFCDSKLSEDDHLVLQHLFIEHFGIILEKFYENFSRGNLLNTPFGQFLAEKHNLECGLKWIVDFDKKEKYNTKLCCITVSTLSAGYNPDKKQNIKYLNAGLEAAQEINDTEYQVSFLERLGNSYSDLGKKHLAIESYKKAIEIYNKSGKYIDEGIVKWWLSKTYLKFGYKEMACASAKEALLIFETYKIPSESSFEFQKFALVNPVREWIEKTVVNSLKLDQRNINERTFRNN